MTGNIINNKSFTFVASISVLFLDQITKIYVRLLITHGESIPILPGIFYLTHLRNPGAAFGIFPNRQLALLIVGLFIVSLILFFLKGLATNRLVSIAFGLALGGALGNLIDRFIYGEVTDFLDFRIWPVFNLADVSIVAGVFLLYWHILVLFWQRRKTIE
jgi:signal peptidase II